MGELFDRFAVVSWPSAGTFVLYADLAVRRHPYAGVWHADVCPPRGMAPLPENSQILPASARNCPCLRRVLQSERLGAFIRDP